MGISHTALVTGASRGIGAAIAQALAEDGYSVLAPTRAAMDLRSDASIDAYLRTLAGPIHVLVNTAGINPVSPLPEIADDSPARDAASQSACTLPFVAGRCARHDRERFRKDRQRELHLEHAWPEGVGPATR